MEYLDIYDINRMKTGRTIVRGEKPENGFYLVVQIVVFNSEGRMLIQQRQSDKLGWPNLWDISAGGAVQAGENSQQAAGRELYEELGIRMDFQGVRPRVNIAFNEGNTDVYLVEKDILPEALHIQAEEVQDVCWATLEEIHKLIKDGAFVPYFPSWISFFFESRKQYGSFRQ